MALLQQSLAPQLQRCTRYSRERQRASQLISVSEGRNALSIASFIYDEAVQDQILQDCGRRQARCKPKGLVSKMHFPSDPSLRAVMPLNSTLVMDTVATTSCLSSAQLSSGWQDTMCCFPFVHGLSKATVILLTGRTGLVRIGGGGQPSGGPHSS